MKITVKAFATVKDIFGFEQENLSIEDKSTVADLLLVLTERFPLLKESEKNLLFAINDEYVSLETELNENDICAIFPPVSGG